MPIPDISKKIEWISTKKTIPGDRIYLEVKGSPSNIAKLEEYIFSELPLAARRIEGEHEGNWLGVLIRADQSGKWVSGDPNNEEIMDILIKIDKWGLKHRFIGYDTGKKYEYKFGRFYKER